MYAHIYEVYVRGLLWRRTTHLLLKCQYAFEARCRKQKDAEDYRTASSANAKKQQRGSNSLDASQHGSNERPCEVQIAYHTS